MRSPAAWARGVRHPEAYHGTDVTGGFFEGWYVKLVDAPRTARWAVIPGVFRPVAGEAEAFVQVLDGTTGRSWYHAFAEGEFEASDRAFDVRVGPNRFTAGGVDLDLPQLRGHLEYTTPLQPWPVTAASPGIMGWYGLVPFMECFHGIVSLGHDLAGVLEIDGAAVGFGGGRGYIEKDWGSAFPSGYVWLASNHLDTPDGMLPDASMVASVAIIPWLGGAFRGWICGLRHDGRLYRWTTYNRSRQRLLRIDDTRVQWSLDGPDGILHLDAERARGGLLHAPARTAMHRRVEETLDARVHIRHEDRRGRVLREAVGACAGLEVFGDIDRLLQLRGR